MSVRAEAPVVLPGYGWWAMLAAVLAAGFLVNWAVAAGLLVLLLIQGVRPLEFLPAYLVAVTGAAFIFNEGGGLTAQLGLVTLAVLVALLCYAVVTKSRAFSVPTSTLTVPLLAFILLTLGNSFRGYLVGAPAKNIGLELLPLLGLGSALLVANVFEPRRDLRLVLFWAIAIGYGVSVWGFNVFSQGHIHLTGFYSMAIPGMTGVLLVNLALRARTPGGALGWVLLSVLPFLHQFITFGRGLWTGCIAGLAISIAIFAGVGRGTGARWRRVGLVVGILVALAVAGAIQAALLLGRTDVLAEAWTRFTSIGTVDTHYGARSNAIRLVEYARVLELIRQSPVVGYGVGSPFTLKDPFTGHVDSPWGVHQNFLMVWFKQGLVGLILFIWMLVAAMVLGAREARRRKDAWESAWLASTAAATMFLVVFSLSNYPFARVNETFFLAMLWGGAMAMTRAGSIQLRWTASSTRDAPRGRT